MSRPLTSRLTPIAVTLALGLVVACTPASDQPSAEQALCDSLTAFADSVRAIGDLDPTTDSIEDIQASAAASEEAWQDVKDAAAAVDEADEAAVEAAWGDLSQQIGDFSTDIPLADALGEVGSGIDAVQGAYDEMRDGLGCE